MTTDAIRERFPALRERPERPTPAYLDSACMSLVPQEVLDAMGEYYRDFPGCGGRSLHRYAEEVGHRFEASREAFAKFLGVDGPASVVFTRNATEGLNVVGQGLAWEKGDRVLVSDQEHNSNLVLWQRLVQERGIRLEILPLPEDGSFPSDELERRLEDGVRLISLFQTSNLDGRSLPIAEIVERAHDHGTEVLFDGCQAAPHGPVDLGKLGVDYYAISTHKMLGPTGTGILTGRAAALGQLRPLLVGGETVKWTTLEGHELRPPPHRFEAGLQNYAGVIGAHAGLRVLQEIGFAEVERRERAANDRVSRALADRPGIRLLGPPDVRRRSSIFAFALAGIDPNDAALFLDEGHRVLVRSGMHCVHSWYAAHHLTGNVRASFYLYTNTADADALVAGVEELLATFGAGPSGTSAPTPTAATRSERARSRAAGSRAAAARSARPRGRAARGRAGS